VRVRVAERAKTVHVDIEAFPVPEAVLKALVPVLVDDLREIREVGEVEQPVLNFAAHSARHFFLARLRHSAARSSDTPSRSAASSSSADPSNRSIRSRREFSRTLIGSLSTDPSIPAEVAS
jgi:hypothetical protein